MSTIVMSHGVSSYYKDWGPKDGHRVPIDCERARRNVRYLAWNSQKRIGR